jgi:group I intron endonuclease
MIIYLITNCANGKIYVGLTKHTAEFRFWKHVVDARNGKGKALYKDILQFGPERFKVEMLCEAADIDRANELEKMYIARYRSTDPAIGYNVLSGGSPNSVAAYTADVRRRIGAIHKGKVLSAETRAKMSASKKGKPGHRWSEEAKEQISKRMMGNRNQAGRKLSAETRAKMSASAARVHTGRKHSPEERAKRSASIKASWARRPDLKKAASERMIIRHALRGEAASSL